MKNKILYLAVIFIMTISSIPIFAVDAAETSEIIDSGECGDEAVWTFDKSGTLTISGEGAIYDVPSIKENQPWYKYSDDINTIRIMDGITVIGEKAFACCENIENVYIPDSIVKMDVSAFSNTPASKDVYFNNTERQWKATFGINDFKYSKIHYYTEEETKFSVQPVQVWDVTITNPLNIIGIAVQDIDANCVLIVAVQKDDETLYTYTEQISSKTEDVFVEIPPEYFGISAYAKAFIWDGLGSMKPLSPSSRPVKLKKLEAN